jgi:hypothetical protein
VARLQRLSTDAWTANSTTAAAQQLLAFFIPGCDTVTIEIMHTLAASRLSRARTADCSHAAATSLLEDLYIFCELQQQFYLLTIGHDYRT